MQAEIDARDKALTAKILDKVAADPDFRARFLEDPDAALYESELGAEARALDAERKAKGPRSPLHGIPIVLKDLIDVAGEDPPIEIPLPLDWATFSWQRLAPCHSGRAKRARGRGQPDAIRTARRVSESAVAASPRSSAAPMRRSSPSFAGWCVVVIAGMRRSSSSRTRRSIASCRRLGASTNISTDGSTGAKSSPGGQDQFSATPAFPGGVRTAAGRIRRTRTCPSTSASSRRDGGMRCRAICIRGRSRRSTFVSTQVSSRCSTRCALPAGI